MRDPFRQPRAFRALLRAARCAVLLLPLAAPATALDITYGDVVASSLESYGFSNGNNSNASFDGGATGELGRLWGYLGNATGTVRVEDANFDVLAPIFQTAADRAMSSLSLDANGAAALGLAAGDIEIDYTFTLVDDTSAQDLDGLLWDIEIRNTSASDLTLTFYQYLDFDLGGHQDRSDDLASANTTRIFITDADSADRFLWSAANDGADHFEVDRSPDVRNLLDGMGAAADLSDAEASFGPGDFSAAYQFDFFLPAGASLVLASSHVSVPEPSPALLTMSGLVGISLVSRRARRRARSYRAESASSSVIRLEVSKRPPPRA